jgi:hypothetical protein
MNTTPTTMILNNSQFISALAGLQQFVLETDADIDMAYDWVSEQSGIKSFVHDMDAWSMFYDVYTESFA